MERQFDAGDPELMDVAASPSPALREDLANLEILNRWFGGWSLVSRLVARWWSPSREWKIVDLATGYGDIPRHLVRSARRQGVTVKITAVEFNPATLALAQEASQKFGEIEYVRGDIRQWSIPPDTDILLCSLALHHFSAQDATGILRRMKESGARHVLVTDLWRNRWLQFGVWFLTATVLRAPMTRHDARVSVRRAFSRTELESMAREAGWRNYEWAHSGGVRQALWLL
jgi:ubiquinone/menaquinone biosynthesis C-methylase UbiE